MNQIKVFNRYKDIEYKNEVILLIKEQMKSIKANKSEEEIDNALRNALMEGKRASLFVCYDEKDVVGFIFGNVSSGIESGRDYFWINEIHVKEEKRRKKIGSLLIKYLEKWLSEQGIKYIACMTGKDNEASQKMFKKLEFDENDVVWIDKNIV